MKRLDLAGRKIGELTVIGYSHSHIQPSGQKRAVWDVECSCGVRKKISTGTLLHGTTVSCGHVGKERRRTSRLLPGNEAEKNYLFLSYAGSARARKIDFGLTKEEFEKLIFENCHYCDSAPSNIKSSRVEGKDGLRYNGIDRVDNSGGYFADNVVTCCVTCNMMKRNMTKCDFEAHIKRIATHVEKRL